MGLGGIEPLSTINIFLYQEIEGRNRYKDLIITLVINQSSEESTSAYDNWVALFLFPDLNEFLIQLCNFLKV